MSNYYVYILTNNSKTTLYIGVTKNVKRRIGEHMEAVGSFAYRYKCFNLIYLEHYTNIHLAIAREKQLKKWSRAKKELLIFEANPNKEFFEV